MKFQYSLLPFILILLTLWGGGVQSAWGQCNLEASFSFEQSSQQCAGTSIVFTNTSTGINSSSPTYTWQINGITVATTPDLTYTFNNSGNYWVVLHAHSNNCVDDYWQYVTINNIPPANFSFSLNNLTAYFNAPFTAGFSYVWQFGDGATQTNNDNTVEHTYNGSGNYEACLTIQAPNACANTHCIMLLVGNNNTCPLSAHFTPNQSGTVCTNTEVSFTNNSIVPSGLSANFQWRVNGNPVSNNPAGYATVFANPGNYIISLTAMSDPECSSVYTYELVVQEPFTPEITISPTSSTGYAFYVMPPPLQAGSSSFAYSWTFGDGSMLQGNSNIIDYTYGNTGNFDVNVSINTTGSNNGCNANVSGGQSLAVTNNCSNNGSCVVPGDTNDDGLINMDDLLSLGLVPPNSTGPQRPYSLYNNPLEQIPQTCSNWAGQQINGANYKHADSNGNGLIELSDKAAIEQNYTDELPTAAPDESSNVLLLTNALKIGSIDGIGDTLQFNLQLTDTLGNDISAYGIRFDAQFLLQGNTININDLKADFTSSWLGENLMNLSKKNLATHTITGGSTRYNIQDTTGGGGAVGTLQSIIDVDILGLSPVEEIAPAEGDVILQIVLKNIKITTANGQETRLGQKVFAYRLHTIPTFQVQAKVWLQGAYNSDTKEMNIPDPASLPLTQPYNQPPWNYNGSEQINNNLSSTDNVTDWIFVELYDSFSNSMLHQKAGVLSGNGQISDATKPQSGLLSFYTPAGDSPYRVIVRHRNHMAIISDPITLQNKLLVVDFTNGDAISSQTTPITPIGTNTQYAMIAGDFDANGLINYQDFNAWVLHLLNPIAYNNADCTLDGDITLSDINFTIQNIARMGHPLIRF